MVFRLKFWTDTSDKDKSETLEWLRDEMGMSEGFFDLCEDNPEAILAFVLILITLIVMIIREKMKRDDIREKYGTRSPNRSKTNSNATDSDRENAFGPATSASSESMSSMGDIEKGEEEDVGENVAPKDEMQRWGKKVPAATILKGKQKKRAKDKKKVQLMSDMLALPPSEIKAKMTTSTQVEGDHNKGIVSDSDGNACGMQSNSTSTGRATTSTKIMEKASKFEKQIKKNPRPPGLIARQGDDWMYVSDGAQSSDRDSRSTNNIRKAAVLKIRKPTPGIAFENTKSSETDLATTKNNNYISNDDSTNDCSVGTVQPTQARTRTLSSEDCSDDALANTDEESENSNSNHAAVIPNSYSFGQVMAAQMGNLFGGYFVTPHEKSSSTGEQKSTSASSTKNSRANCYDGSECSIAAGKIDSQYILDSDSQEYFDEIEVESTGSCSDSGSSSECDEEVASTPLTRFFYNSTQKNHFLTHFKGFFDFFFLISESDYKKIVFIDFCQDR